MSRNIFLFCVKTVLNVSNKRLIQYGNTYTLRYICINTRNSYKNITSVNLNTSENEQITDFKHTVKKLKHLFGGVPIEQARNLLYECPELEKCDWNLISENYDFYRSNGISKDILLQYPLLLVFYDAKLKMKCLKRLDNVDLNSIAPILLTNKRLLIDIVQHMQLDHNVPYNNRIIYISKVLNLPAPKVAYKLLNHAYIFRMPLDRLQENFKILLDFGVERINIYNDFWILRYGKDTIIERLQKVVNADVKKLKTWMIRCPESVLQRSIDREIENRIILASHSSIEEYLSKRLDCTIENAKYLTSKYPALMKKNSLKLNEIIDFLYEQGFTPAHVCRVPRILVHSLETTTQRLQKLKQIGYVPPSLAVLCKSKKEFDKVIKKQIVRKAILNSKKGN